MPEKSSETSSFRNRRFGISIVSIILSLLPVIREAIAGTADLLEILNTAGAKFSILAIVFIGIVNLAILYFSHRETIQETNTVIGSSKTRTVKRKIERDQLKFYRKSTYGLIALTCILAASVLLFQIRYVPSLNYQAVVAEYSEQIDRKQQVSNQKLYEPLLPSPGSVIHQWELFSLEKYSVGDIPEGFHIDRGQINLVFDPNDPGNLALQFSSAQDEATLTFGNTYQYFGNQISQKRVKVLLGNIEGTDREWHTETIVVDNQKGGVQLFFDGEDVTNDPSRVKRLESTMPIVPQDWIVTSNPSSVSIPPYSTYLFDDFIEWSEA